jgi:hypothetical protein
MLPYNAIVIRHVDAAPPVVFQAPAVANEIPEFLPWLIGVEATAFV